MTTLVVSLRTKRKFAIFAVDQGDTVRSLPTHRVPYPWVRGRHRIIPINLLLHNTTNAFTINFANRSPKATDCGPLLPE